MRKPLIGITTYAPGESGRYFLATEYIHAIQRTGGVPILFPPVADHAQIWLDRVDGLMLPGGGDIDPLLYGAPPHETVYGVNPTRDAVEIALLRAAHELRIPMLLICRGMQLLNVALDGTLHQHVPESFGDAVPHRGPERTVVRHPVVVDSTSTLAEVLGATAFEVSSLHHQAIDRLAPALRAVAHAPDGLIEACEARDRWLIAVQWHPELSVDNDPIQRRLFEAFVEAAATRLRAAA